MTIKTPAPTVSDDINCTTVAGFPALAIARIRGAQQLNKITLYLVLLALIIFVIFGTLASLKVFNDNQSIYVLFHYVPYGFVGLAIPLMLYQAFIVARYRLSQPSMMVTSVGLAATLTLVCLIFRLENWLWMAMASWIGVAYWFQATFKRFFKFIEAQ